MNFIYVNCYFFKATIRYVSYYREISAYKRMKKVILLREYRRKILFFNNERFSKADSF